MKSKTLLRITLAMLGGIVVLALGLVYAGTPIMTSGVFVCFPDGAVRRISPEEGTYYQACIHPEGTSVLFAGAATGPPIIWKADLPSGELHRLTTPDSASFQATYSWDGERIVFSSDRAFGLPSVGVEEIPDPRLYRGGTRDDDHYRHFNLFLMNPDGGDVVQITHGTFRDLRATFHPTGESLVFYSTRKPFAPLWRMPTDGSEEPESIPIDRPRWDMFRPWFTADGEELYFFGKPKSETRPRIAHVPVAGGKPIELGWDGEGKSAGPFLPQTGDVLLFHTNGSGLPELWEMPLDGGPFRMISPEIPTVSKKRRVMHPTRASDGTMTFDVSYRQGSALRCFLQDKAGRVRFHWNALWSS